MRSRHVTTALIDQNHFLDKLGSRENSHRCREINECLTCSGDDHSSRIFSRNASRTRRNFVVVTVFSKIATYLSD